MSRSRSPELGPAGPEREPDARTTAVWAPTLTSASGGAPRNDSKVASHPTASNRLVLPWPLPPLMTVSPDGAKVTEALA